MNLDFFQQDVEFKVKGKPISLIVIHNMSDDEGFSFNDALQSWIPRTDDFTAESLCSYIMSKGLDEVYAFTKSQYEEMQSTMPSLKQEFTTEDFINPLLNKTEDLTVYALEENSDTKYVCVHDGEETVIFMNDLGHWVGDDNMETPLTIALGSLVEHHTA